MVADGITTNYTYDKNSRLLHTDTNGAMVDYNYDNNGNLYSKLYSSITPATGEAEGVSADLLQQPQLSAMNLTMEEQPLTVEELFAIMEQEPGKPVKEILAERRPMLMSAQPMQKTAEFFTYNERGQLVAYQSGSATASYTYGADVTRKQICRWHICSGIWSRGNGD